MKDPEIIKNKMRGKNSAGSRYIRKMNKRNVMDEKRARYEAVRDQGRREKAGVPLETDRLGPALARFAKPPAK